jgi:hypothetical protein
MCNLTQIQTIHNQIQIWNILNLSFGALGMYSAFILLVQDRLRWKQRSLLGIYIASLSFLLFHLNGMNQSTLWVWKALNLMGMTALFLLGPLSLFMSFGHTKNRLAGKFVIHLIPGMVILAGLYFDLMGNSTGYVLGMIHAGIYSIIQIIRFLPLLRNSRLIWNINFATMQLLLLVGVSISHVYFSDHLSRILGSAALGIMILLIWVRIMYSAYLSYLISKS